MASTTQRLKYYTGEFLQSGDFTDEQSYHVAMRRLLNQELHLEGIVRGAHIVKDQNSVAPVDFLSVAPGFIIDQIGREIYVSAPTSLTPLLSRPGLKAPLQYELWIVYTETASGSPAPGYQLCNQPSQNTRWTELFELMLRNPAQVPDPNTPDPKRDLKGICLGLVNVHYDSTLGFYFTLPLNDWYRRRHYAEIRAQAIIAPDDIREPNSYNFYGPAPSYAFPPPPEGYVYIKTQNGVYSDGNMLIQGNMLVGDDFVLDNGNLDSKNLPGNLPKARGNLKVAADLFLQGQLFYYNSSGPWLLLDDYIKNLSASPVIQFTTGSTSAFSTPTTVSVPGSVNATIAKFSSVLVQASISGLTFVASQVPAAQKPAVSVTPVQPATQSGVKGDPVGFSANCIVSGGPGSLIDGVDVLFIVVFQP